MTLSTLLIIIVVFAVIIGNIMLLKHTANMPMTKVKDSKLEKATERLKQPK